MRSPDEFEDRASGLAYYMSQRAQFRELFGEKRSWRYIIACRLLLLACRIAKYDG